MVHSFAVLYFTKYEVKLGKSLVHSYVTLLHINDIIWGSCHLLRLLMKLLKDPLIYLVLSRENR